MSETKLFSRSKADSLINFLNSIQDENKQLAEWSVQVIEKDLDRLLGAKSKEEKDNALSSLLYSIGGRGIFDSNWNQINLKSLEKLCEDLRSSLKI